MKKIIIAVLLLFPIFLRSQDIGFFFSMNDTYNNLFEKSCSQGMILLRQEYQIEDTNTHQRYTLNNRSDFGSAISFAVLTEQGMITQAKIIRPWDEDPNYIPYRDSCFRPLLTKTQIRCVSDSTWQDHPLMQAQSAMALHDSLRVIVQSDVFKKGFRIDSLQWDGKGWFLWLTENASGQLVFSMQRCKYKGHESPQNIQPLVKEDEKLCGGIYIAASFETIGQIQFLLRAILWPADSKWEAIPIVFNQKTSSVLTPIEKPDDTPEKTVTPPKKKCGKDGKDKKNKKGKEKK